MNKLRACAASIEEMLTMEERAHLERIARDKGLALTVFHAEVGDLRDLIGREVFYPSPHYLELDIDRTIPQQTPEGSIHGITISEYGCWLSYADGERTANTHIARTGHDLAMYLQNL